MKRLLIPLLAVLTGAVAAAGPDPQPRVVQDVRDGSIGNLGGDPPISAWSLFLGIEGDARPLILPPYVVTSLAVTRANPAAIGASPDVHYRICVQNVSDHVSQNLGSVAFAELSPPDPKAKSGGGQPGFKLHLADLPRALKPKQKGCVEGDLKPLGASPSIWVLTPQTRPKTPRAGAKP